MARSPAYADFREALSLAKALMRQETGLVREPPAGDQLNIAGGMRGGAAVLMVAAFEAFMVDLVTQEVERIAKSTPPVQFQKLPEALRVANVFFTLERALKGPRFGPAKKKVDRLADIKLASQTIAQDGLSPSVFATTGGNPGPEVVKRLLVQIGVGDIFRLTKPRFAQRWARPIHETFVQDKLAEIVARRHRVAHQADALSISRVDLREGERFLRLFAEVLDIEVGAHARRLCRTCR